MQKDKNYINIGKRKIGKDYPCFIIAEAGANHNGSVTLAKKLIKVAKEAGADCVKFQTFSADIFCTDKNKKFTYKSQGKKVTENEYRMFKRLEFNIREWKEIISYCKKNKILFLTTIQDPINLTMMKKLGLQGIKVGSDDFDHLDNLRIYCNSKLPIILSKGMSNKNEFNNTLKFLKKNYSFPISILHCVSIYPSDPQDLNLNHLKHLINKYKDIIWGFSDHSTSTITPALSVMLGAKIIEKHFTIDNNLPGPDHWFSMNPRDLKKMVNEIRFAEKTLGSSEFKISRKELFSKNIMRRKLVANKNLYKNDFIKAKDIAFKRSLKGEQISNLKKVIGGKLKKSIKINDGIEIKNLILKDEN